MANRIGTKSASANMQVIDLTDGRQVCLSYGVIVAAFIPADYRPNRAVMSNDARIWYTMNDVQARGHIRTDARYSVTTSKHMNQFAGNDAPTVPDAVLKALCAPVVSR